MVENGEPKLCRVLSLDGGGAKGFYTLGVLKQIEGLIQRPLCERFDLVFGTSTGSIIAALICLGYSVDDIHGLYRDHVVKVMRRWTPWGKTAALKELAEEVFGKADFSAFKTGVGIVSTDWDIERPKIFKTSVNQAYQGAGTFVPGFGCTIADAVQASCSAFPFFCRHTVTTGGDGASLLADGGFCANNPTLYAIADATRALGFARQNVRVVSIGVGQYPRPKRYLSLSYWFGYLFTVRLLQKVLEVNTQSMEQLRFVLYSDVPTVRISDAYTQPELATDLFEHDMKKLGKLWKRGQHSYERHEDKLKEYLL